MILVIACMATACAMNPRVENLTATQRSRIASIQVFQTDIQRPYNLVDQVDGLSCNRNKYQAQDVTYEEAMQGVKIKAVLLDADAVINVFCQKNSDTDWINNCWASIKCIGDAVKYK
jgi:uncharacterized protein YbjQ (UPF0145 family)